jgi:hypothetical protein
MNLKVMKPCLAIIAAIAFGGFGLPVWAAATEANSNMVPARAMLTMGGIVTTPARKVSPRLEGTNLPAPPMQQAPWTLPSTGLPSNYVSATWALFDAGMADPRGCECREVEVGTGSVWSGDGGVVSTHGWLLPGRGTQRFAVCWNGLVYPVVSVGSNASVTADVGLLKTNGLRTWYTAIPEGMSVSHLSLLPLKGCMLLRLGEAELARDYWITCERRRLEYEDAIWSRARSGTNPPAPRTEVELPAGDPFLGWATDWTWAMFDRAICAHMRGDDGLALASARALIPIQQTVEKEAERRGFKRQPTFDPGPWSGRYQPYLSFLGPLPALLADQERRLLKPRRPTVAEAGITNYPDSSKRIAALIEDLDELAVRQSGQPGGLGGFGGDFAVSMLIKEGTNAIGPLLKCLETDAGQRLTRSVSFGRDFHMGRWLHPIQEPILEILHRITGASSFGAWATTNELIAAGTNANRATAAQIRAYWRKFHDVPQEERWYLTLLDNNAGAATWADALGNIVSPMTSTNQPAPLRGEVLRLKRNPSLSELLLNRASALDLMAISKWDCQAALPLLQERMRKDLDLWARTGKLAVWSGEFNAAGGYDCLWAVNRIIEVTIERARAGDLFALSQYALWVCSIRPDHYPRSQDPGPADRRELCEPMWRFPTDPAVSNAANFVFTSPESPLAGPLSLTNGTKSYVVEKAGTRLMAFASFRLLVLQGLRDTNTAGSATLGTNGWLSISTPHQNSGNLIGTNFDASRIKLGATVSFRVCDYLAQQLSVWEGLPKVELYWTETFRDDAVAQCIRELENPGADFAHRKRNKAGEDPGS